MGSLLTDFNICSSKVSFFAIIGLIYFIFFSAESVAQTESIAAQESLLDTIKTGNNYTAIRGDSNPSSKSPSSTDREKKSATEDSLLEMTIDEIEYRRDDWSKKITTLAKKVDRFISQEDSAETVNESFMRLKLSNTFNESGDHEEDVSLKIKIDLPISKQHYRFVLENDPDDQQSLGEKSLTQDKGKLSDEENKHFLAGFRYLLSGDTDKWYVATDTGVRIRLHSQAFVRTKMRRSYQLDENWLLQLRENIYYFSDDGLGEKTQVFLQRPVTDRITFRSTTEAQWSKDEDIFEYAQFYSFLQSLSPKKAIEYRFGIIGESVPNDRVTNYSFIVNYRKLIYKNWLFFEVGPGIVFDREDDFDLAPTLAIKFEVFFLSEETEEL